MSFTTKKIELTQEWQLLLDNSSNTSNADNSFYVNDGSAIFVYSDDTPSVNYGMRISAGARIIPVPIGAKLWGKLNINPDQCSVIINIDE